MKVLWFLPWETVRDVCIKNNLYNAGSNEDYENLASMVAKGDKGFTLEDVVEIADDIAAHTDGEFGGNGKAIWIAERLLNAAFTGIF